mgnify:CR=1 FL=1
MAACALAVVMAVFFVTPAGAVVDTGMEGLWTGPTGGGQLTLLFGSGGIFISIFEADQTYRQAGEFTVDRDNMHLTMSDGTASTLQYGFSEGELSLSGDGLDAVLRRIDFTDEDGLAGVWVMDAANGESGLVAMDANGGFASVDAATGETAKGIYLPDQGDLLIAYQDGTSMQVSYVLDASNGVLTLTNPGDGTSVALSRFELLTTK